jgi:hypothetical protein
MPSKIDALVPLMRNNEDLVFARTGIRWKFVEQELRKKGVEKSLMAIKGFLYFLQRDPRSGVQSW